MLLFSIIIIQFLVNTTGHSVGFKKVTLQFIKLCALNFIPEIIHLHTSMAGSDCFYYLLGFWC